MFFAFLLEHAPFLLFVALVTFIGYATYEFVLKRGKKKDELPKAPPAIQNVFDLLAEAHGELARALCDNIELREALEAERRFNAREVKRLQALRESHEWAGDVPVPVVVMATWDGVAGCYTVAEEPLFGSQVDRVLDDLVKKDEYQEF